jgi:hypothetical protein
VKIHTMRVMGNHDFEASQADAQRRNEVVAKWFES